MEEILESLITDLVAEEQRKNVERRGLHLGEPSKLQDSKPVLSELQLKESQLQDQEHALSSKGQPGAEGTRALYLRETSRGQIGQSRQCGEELQLPEGTEVFCLASGSAMKTRFTSMGKAKRKPQGARILRVSLPSPSAKT